MMNLRNPNSQLPPKPFRRLDDRTLDSGAIDTSLNAKIAEENRDNIEDVMKDKFLERAHRQFHKSESLSPKNGRVSGDGTAGGSKEEYIKETINVEGVPRTIYLNSNLSQRTLAKIRD